MPNDGWRDLVAGLSAAGRDLDESTAELGAAERADGQLALLRAVNNLLGRFEVDRDAPNSCPSTAGAKSSSWTTPITATG